MQGVYLVAAELSQRGLIVSPTSRSAAGADLLVTDQFCKKAFSVQVKTKRNSGDWILTKKAKEIRADSHIYVLVHLRKNGFEKEFFILPSRVLAKKVSYTKNRTGTEWYHISFDDAKEFRDNWAVFGKIVE